MGTITVDDGLVKYSTGGTTYYVKHNFAPSVQVFQAEVPQKKRRGIPETFFSNGPVEKLVSLLGLGRCNVVLVKLASDLELSSLSPTTIPKWPPDSKWCWIPW